MHMSEIGRQLRQQTLHIISVTIPGNQAMHCERMSKIMKSRLKTSSISALNASSNTQSAEGGRSRPHGDSFPRTGHEERGIRLPRMVPSSCGLISGKHTDEIGTERHDSCLVELAIADMDDS